MELDLSGKEGTDMKIKERFSSYLKIFLLFAFVFSFLTLLSAGSVLAQGDIVIEDFEYEIDRVDEGYELHVISVWISNTSATDKYIDSIVLSCSGGDQIKSFEVGEVLEKKESGTPKSPAQEFYIDGYWILPGVCTEVFVDVEYDANSVKTKSFTIDAAEYYTLSREADLNFGSFSADAVGTTVTVYPSGGINYDSPVHLEDYQSAEFKLEGPAGSNFSVVLPANGEITVYNGSASMSVVDFDTNSTGIIGNDYTEYFNVGATLEVDPLQTPGTYTGVFSVIITLP